MAKNLVLGLLLTHLYNFRLPNFFFFKNLAPLVTGYHGQLSSCTISENNNDRILRKISDGQTDRQIDRQTDESDFMGCCLTNVERPIRIRFNHYNSKKY